MKIAILGDIHGNLEALEAVLAKAAELSVDAYACIGDVVGYNANPHECLERIRGLNLIGAVKGNHDEYASVKEDAVGFNPMAALAVKWTRSQLTDDDLTWLRNLPYTCVCKASDFGRFILVHATLDSPKSWGYVFDRFFAEASFVYQRFYPVCFIGHTHVPVYFEKTDSIKGGNLTEIKLEHNHQYLINVGSVGQPRDGNPLAAFAVFDTSIPEVKLYRVEYDVKKAQDKILAAELPERLATRLEQGR